MAATSWRAYREFLWRYVSPQGGRVFGLAIALFTGIGLQLLNPQLLRDFIDTAVAGGSQRRLVGVALGFMAIAISRQGCVIAATYLSETVAWSATNELRLHLARHCLYLDLSFHKAHTPGELVEQVDGDVEALAQFFSQFVLLVVGNMLLMVGVLSVLWWEDWRAGLALSLSALVALGVLARIQALAVKPWRVYRQVSAEFYGFVVEYLSGLEDIRANGAVGYVMNRFYRIARRWLAAFHRARFTSTLLWGSTVGLFSVGGAIALAIGAYLWSRNAITIGTVYLLFYYTTQLEEPIETIREELEQFQQAAASFQRIQALLAVQSHLQTGGRAVLPQRALSVQFKEVWFGYGEGPTLEGINFHLPAGKVLGLLGHTGSGKSTIARLLLRLYDIQKGEIQLGGINVNQVSLRELPHRVGLVTQDVQLFQTTVRNNLTFFNPHILDQHILKIIEDLGLMPWLASLPQGLDTMLGTDSSGLSAGQAQLLAFARVFLKDPGLVILDEASSQLDPQTEALIEKVVDRLLTNRTGIIVAHRLETVARADQILILERGKVLEYGDRSVLERDTHSRFSHLLATEFSLR